MGKSDRIKKALRIKEEELRRLRKMFPPYPEVSGAEEFHKKKESEMLGLPSTESMFPGGFDPHKFKIIRDTPGIGDGEFTVKFDSKFYDKKLLDEMLSYDPKKHMGAVISSPRGFGKSDMVAAMMWAEMARKEAEMKKKEIPSGKGLLEQIGESASYNPLPTAADIEKLVSDMAGIPPTHIHSAGPVSKYSAGTIVTPGFIPATTDHVEWKSGKKEGPPKFYDAWGHEVASPKKLSELEEALEKRKAWEANRPYEGDILKRSTEKHEYIVDGKKYYYDAEHEKKTREFMEKHPFAAPFAKAPRGKSLVEKMAEEEHVKEVLRAKRPTDVDEEEWNDYVDGKIDWFGNPVKKGIDWSKGMVEGIIEKSMFPKTPEESVFVGHHDMDIHDGVVDADIDGSAVHRFKTRGIEMRKPHDYIFYTGTKGAESMKKVMEDYLKMGVAFVDKETGKPNDELEML